MRHLLYAAATLAAAFLVLGPGAHTVTAARPRPKDVPVVITFDDAASHKLKSDGSALYRDSTDHVFYQDGVANVVAYISSSFNGQLVFGTNTSNQAGRTLKFFFGTRGFG